MAKKINQISKIFLSALASSVTNLLAAHAVAAPFAPAAAPCTKVWAMDGQVKSKNYIYGLGLSTKSDLSEAVQEAKAQAIKDVNAQLMSSVESNSTINETESGSSYSAQIKVQSGVSNLTGIKISKEGSDPAQKITSCVVAKFDASAAYTDSEGKMTILMDKLKDITLSAKQKNYIAVLQKRASVKKLVDESMADITRADMFLIYLKSDEQTWYQKIKGQQVEIERVADQAKTNIVFLVPETPFDGAMADIASRLSGEGYEVIHSGKTAKPIQISVEAKQVGSPRKTKTALGLTYIAKIMVNIKVGGKTIGTNRGVDVIGAGNDEDDALANIDRQLIAQTLQTLQTALPGLISDGE